MTTDSGAEVPQATRHVAAKLNEEFDAKLESDWPVRRVCHIINRAAKVSEALVKPTVEKIRSFLKTIRVSAALHVAFRKIQVPLGKKNIAGAPGLDDENRGNVMFQMIDNCFSVKHDFEAVCSKETFTDALNGLQLSQTDWRKVQEVADFLRPASELKTTGSDSSCVSLSMQPHIYKSHRTHRLSTICDIVKTGFTEPALKRAAE